MRSGRGTTPNQVELNLIEGGGRETPQTKSVAERAAIFFSISVSGAVPSDEGNREWYFFLFAHCFAVKLKCSDLCARMTARSAPLWRGALSGPCHSFPSVWTRSKSLQELVPKPVVLSHGRGS